MTIATEPALILGIGGIDVTVTQSYDWVVNIDSDESTVADSWAFRFVPFEYEDTSGGEISSPTFAISGLRKESSGPIENSMSPYFSYSNCRCAKGIHRH